jgi:hypothetical protein
MFRSAIKQLHKPGLGTTIIISGVTGLALGNRYSNGTNSGEIKEFAQALEPLRPLNNNTTDSIKDILKHKDIGRSYSKTTTPDGTTAEVIQWGWFNSRYGASRGASGGASGGAGGSYSVEAPSPNKSSFLDYLFNIIESKEWGETLMLITDFIEMSKSKVNIFLTSLVNNPLIVGLYIILILIIYSFTYNKFLKKQTIKETFNNFKNWQLHSLAMNYFFSKYFIKTQFFTFYNIVVLLIIHNYIGKTYDDLVMNSHTKLLLTEFVERGGNIVLVNRVLENNYLFLLNINFLMFLFSLILFIKVLVQFWGFLRLNRSYLKYDFDTETSPILEDTKKLIKNNKLFSRFYKYI